MAGFVHVLGNEHSATVALAYAAWMAKENSTEGVGKDILIVSIGRHGLPRYAARDSVKRLEKLFEEFSELEVHQRMQMMGFPPTIRASPSRRIKNMASQIRRLKFYGTEPPEQEPTP